MARLLIYELLLHPLDDHIHHGKVPHLLHHQHHIIIVLGPSPVTISKKQNKDQRWFHRFSFSTEAYSLRKYVKHWVCKSVTYILTNARTTYYFIVDSPKLIFRSQWSNFLVDCIMAWPTDHDRYNFYNLIICHFVTRSHFVTWIQEL